MRFCTAALHLRPRSSTAAGGSTAPAWHRPELPHGYGLRRVLAGCRALSMAAATVLLAAACAPTPEGGFSFAARSGQPQGGPAPAAKSQARFAGDNVVLVAPPGHCIDTSMLRQEPQGGFALLPRCNLMQGASWFGRNRAAVITATIGPAHETGAPSTADLARTAEGARLLYYEDKGLLPLVRLDWPGHGAMGHSNVTGASAEHWRGAFVLNDQLVVLALYAPEGSDLLGQPGAMVLTEMTRRSLAASLAGSTDPQAAATLEGTAHAEETVLRPKPRPGNASQPENQTAATGNSATTGETAQKLSLRKRIARLFQ